MDKMKTVIAAAIVAVGIVVLGFCIKAGLGSFLQNQRVVTVKGLAVREVKANKVIWPIVFRNSATTCRAFTTALTPKTRL